MPKRILLAKGLAKRLLPLAIIIYLLIGIGVPVLYYEIESKALSRNAKVYAQEFSDSIKKLILISPGLWKYEAEKYMDVVREFVPHKDISAIRIMDEKGKLISYHQTENRNTIRLLAATVEGSAPIIFNNHVLGSIRISVSTRSVINKALVIFLFCASLGAALTGLIYFFPVNIARGMETEIKKLVAALRKAGEESDGLRIAAETSERKFRNLVQGLDAVVWEAETGTYNFTFVSRKAEDLLGYPLEEWKTPDFLHGRVFPEDLERTMTHYNDVALGRQSTDECEYRLQRSDGRIVWVRDKVGPAIGQDGSVTHLQGLMMDITERRTFTDLLAAEKERLAVTLRSITDGVITTDTSGIVISLNRAAEKMTGRKEAEAAGKHLNDVFRIMDENKQWFINPIDPTPAQDTGAWGPALLIASDGSELFIEKTLTPMRDFDGEGIGSVLVFRDITERRKMEEELLRIQKLESIRVLAGGIAHDFNNLLTSIIGNISIARKYAAGEGRLLSILSDLEKASFRAHGLTNQLLTFSKGGAPVKKVTFLSDIIRESADFALRGSQLACKFIISENLRPAEVDVGQISQVISNIVINASQAMPHGGAIEIYARNVENAEGTPLTPGHYVKISVRDHGPGIPEEYLPKIFDPFFTTKQEGNGLGLATAYSIIRKHNGHILAEADAVQGTTFHVYLPSSDLNVLPEEQGVKGLLAGKGRVLVMDDEDIVRLIAYNMLEELGYQTETAEDGDQAVERYKLAKEEGRSFDAVIIDLTIRGGMGGSETIRRLTEMDPGVKAIVSSGYFNDPIMSSYREFGFKDVITKPYRIEELGEVLYRVINDITDYRH